MSGGAKPNRAERKYRSDAEELGREGTGPERRPIAVSMTSAKYAGDRWEQARKAALARDRVCQDCGTSENLHVHHIRPVRLFDDYDDAHDLNNLVVLCETCHPEWEGRREAPNLLDDGGRVHLSQLVHDLSRDTIGRLYEPAGPWILYRYYRENMFEDRWRCRECFHKLPNTRSNTDHCPHCGREPPFWIGRDFFNIDVAKQRARFLCCALEKTGIPADVDAAVRVTEKLWSCEEYKENSWTDKLLHNAAYVAIKVGYSPEDVNVGHDPICPLPKPIQTPS